MKYGKSALIVVLLSSFFSCITTKEKNELKEKETEVKTETENNRYIYLKKTTENKRLNFVINLDSLLLNRYQANSQDTGFFFAELKNGKIEIIYIQPKTTEIREEKREEKQTQKQTKKQEIKKEFKKETERRAINFKYGLYLFLAICTIYIFYSINKNFPGKF